MSEEMIGIITPFISLCSLFLGIRNYFVSKPKLKVIISDPESDVYHGLVSKENDKVMSTMVGAVDINIINNSPVDIYIKEIKLKIGKDLHRLVLKDNNYWNDIFFFYYDENGEVIFKKLNDTGTLSENTINKYSFIEHKECFNKFIIRKLFDILNN